MYIGRRPVFIIATGIFFATTIWSGAAQSFESLMAARILGAFAGSTTEALANAIVADLFFLHERGWWMGIFMIVQCTGGTIVGIISGFLIGPEGWRWHFGVHLPFHSY